MFLEFYKLREQPFGVTPDPRFLYMGGAYEETFRSLVRGIETGCGFMAMVAAPGLGKTTLLLRLMAKLQDSALTAFLFQTHTNSQEFLKNLLHDLDVEPKGQDLSDLQHQLQDVLMVGSQSGKRLVLVIDASKTSFCFSPCGFSLCGSGIVNRGGSAVDWKARGGMDTCRRIAGSIEFTVGKISRAHHPARPHGFRTA